MRTSISARVRCCTPQFYLAEVQGPDWATFAQPPQLLPYHAPPITMSKPSQPYYCDLQFRGFIEGLTYIDNDSKPACHFFGGVPYALPPLRFNRPRSLPPCYRYGTKANPARFTRGCGICPQPSFNAKKLDEISWDEDCLQSNIWIPTGVAPAEGMVRF
jgi:hypothetical protein